MPNRSAFTDRAFTNKVGRYSVVSVFNVVLGQVILAVAFGPFGWSARTANVVATLIATPPAYLLNRAWVWQRRGRSLLWREIAPFWAVAFLGLAMSHLIVGYVEHLAAGRTGTRGLQTIAVMASVLAVYGLLWIGRFVLLNSFSFADRAGQADGVA